MDKGLRKQVRDYDETLSVWTVVLERLFPSKKK